MRVSRLVFSTLAALVVAVPTPNNDPSLQSKRLPEDIRIKDGTSPIVSDAMEKRSPQDIQLEDGTWLRVSKVTDEELDERSDSGGKGLNNRAADQISSCGPRSGWMPIKDHDYDEDQPMWGYNSTVYEFCKRASYNLGSTTHTVHSVRLQFATICHTVSLLLKVYYHAESSAQQNAAEDSHHLGGEPPLFPSPVIYTAS
jgi:hypothetical protein